MLLNHLKDNTNTFKSNKNNHKYKAYIKFYILNRNRKFWMFFRQIDFAFIAKRKKKET